MECTTKRHTSHTVVTGHSNPNHCLHLTSVTHIGLSRAYAACSVVQTHVPPEMYCLAHAAARTSRLTCTAYTYRRPHVPPARTA